MAMGYVPPIDYDELVDDYKAGSTVQELAARTGWAQRTVWALLEERGVAELSNGRRYSDAEARELLRRQREARLERERQQRKAEVEQLERANDLARRLRKEREARRRQERDADERRRKETRAGHDAIYLAEVEFERRAQGQLIKWLREYGDILTDQAHT